LGPLNQQITIHLRNRCQHKRIQSLRLVIIPLPVRFSIGAFFILHHGFDKSPLLWCQLQLIQPLLEFDILALPCVFFLP